MITPVGVPPPQPHFTFKHLSTSSSVIIGWNLLLLVFTVTFRSKIIFYIEQCGFVMLTKRPLCAPLVVNWSWRAGCIFFLFFKLFNEEALCHWQIRRDGTIYLVILERKPLIYWQFERGGTILLGKFRKRLVDLYCSCPIKLLEVGWSLILWPMLYLEGWLSSDFIG